jgi:DNA polymerase III psi subunit
MAYLEAMGIGVWQLRAGARITESAVPAASVVQGAAGLKLGPGSGGTLMVCADPADSATRLANDIVRALANVPVWAWPEAGANANAIGLPDAIEEHLFTTVAIFGDDLARQLFEDELPASLKAAKLILLPSMQEIQQQAEARRMLWDTFCRSGMVNTGFFRSEG